MRTRPARAIGDSGYWSQALREGFPTMSRICVIGAGYVGLVTAACMAEAGHEVVSLDIDTAKLAQLQRGEVPFFEPGLQEVLNRVQGLGRIRYTSSYAEAIPKAEFIFIAVETPSGTEGEADLAAVRAAAKELAPLLGAGTVVINKSTVPIGTGDLVASLISHYSDACFAVVSN